MTWIRALLPAAVLLVGAGTAAPAVADVDDVDDVITLEVDGVESGPLSVAHALVRVRQR